MFGAIVSAFCDWMKESQNLKIKDEINNQTINVYRGSNENVVSILVRDLVVGDLIEIQAGDRIPADCILVDEMNVQVD